VTEVQQEYGALVLECPLITAAIVQTAGGE
jgi:hypothetical protein